MELVDAYAEATKGLIEGGAGFNHDRKPFSTR